MNASRRPTDVPHDDNKASSTHEEAGAHYLLEELTQEFLRDPQVLDWLDDVTLDGLWYWDLTDPAHEWMSPRFWKTLGIDPTTKRHLAEEWQGLIHPDDLALAKENAAQHIADPDHPYDQVVRYRHADGHWVWVRCRGLALRDAEGNARRMIGAHHDVTALENAKAALQQQMAEHEAEHQRFESLFELVPAAIVVVNPDDTIALTNRALAQLVDSSGPELIGLPITELLPAWNQVLEKIPPRTEGSLSGEPTGSGDQLYWEVQGRSGAKVPVTVVHRELPDSAGAAPQRLALLIDVRERLAHEDELERSNDELQRFAYAASHDLQEPLRMVTNFTELLERRYAEQLDDRARRYIHFATDGAQRMQRLIQDLLTYSRVGAGKPDLLAVEPKKLLNAALGSLSLALQEAGATVEVEGDLEPVLADPSRLQQVFQNLISNAVKFRAADRPPRVVVGCTPADDGRVRLWVRDNGIGVSPEARDRVFEVFQRLHEIGKYEGSGIGLSIVQRIVQLHGGEAWISDSTVGKGTEVSFTLTRAPARTQEQP